MMSYFISYFISTWSCFISPHYRCSWTRKHTDALFFKVAVGMLGICVCEPRSLLFPGWEYPFSSSPAQLQHAGQPRGPGAEFAREQCQRFSRGSNVSEGGSGLPSHPPGPADLQIFQFYCPWHRKEKFKPLTSSLPAVPSGSFFMDTMVHLSIWIGLILLGFSHWKISRMQFEWPNQTLLC